MESAVVFVMDFAVEFVMEFAVVFVMEVACGVCEEICRGICDGICAGIRDESDPRKEVIECVMVSIVSFMKNISLAPSVLIHCIL